MVASIVHRTVEVEVYGENWYMDKIILSDPEYNGNAYSFNCSSGYSSKVSSDNAGTKYILHHMMPRCNSIFFKE